MHVPTLPGCAHDWHRPAQSDRQQMPSKQKPLLQSVGVGAGGADLARPASIGAAAAAAAAAVVSRRRPARAGASPAAPAMSIGASSWAASRRPARAPPRRRRNRRPAAPAAKADGRCAWTIPKDVRATSAWDSSRNRVSGAPVERADDPPAFARLLARLEQLFGDVGEPPGAQLTRPDAEVVGRNPHQLGGDVRRQPACAPVSLSTMASTPISPHRYVGCASSTGASPASTYASCGGSAFMETIFTGLGAGAGRPAAARAAASSCTAPSRRPSPSPRCPGAPRSTCASPSRSPPRASRRV